VLEERRFKAARMQGSKGAAKDINFEGEGSKEGSPRKKGGV